MDRTILCFILLAIGGSPIWGQGYSDYIGNGHLNGIQVKSSASATDWSANHVSLDGLTSTNQVVLADASRFLAQATLGANMAEIERTAAIGFEAWIDEQIAMAPTYVRPNMDAATRFLNEYFGEEEEIAPDDSPCQYFPDVRTGWWHTVMTADDQLRHRVAFALSEILVVSETSDALEDACDGMADYVDLMVAYAFGNYRDLLFEVTMHPVMGFYLTHYNNPKTDSANNIHPDENYAREIMQLFSIGLYELNLDGSRKLDANGNPIPTYTNPDIKEYAKVFTGLGPNGYGEDPEDEEEPFEVPFGEPFEVIVHTQPMRMFEEQHEPGPKYLLRGQVLPSGQTGMQDINDAIDNLFHHPNVGPFISRLLIQRLVTSNPTPDYIARVAATFNNNGQGVRGDLGAVVKAILMDEQARACTDREANVHRAMLREPIVRYTHFCRAMEIQPIEDFPYHVNYGFRFDYATGQMVLSAPSVFNFFLPDYQPNGPIGDLGLYAPEFQIHNSTSSIAFVNEVNDWTFTEQLINFYHPADDLEGYGQEDETAIAAFERDRLELMAGDPQEYLDYLDLLFTHGQLSTQSRSIILKALQDLDDPYDRVNMGLYLIMISPDYAVLN